MISEKIEAGQALQTKTLTGGLGRDGAGRSGENAKALSAQGPRQRGDA